MVLYRKGRRIILNVNSTIALSRKKVTGNIFDNTPNTLVVNFNDNSIVLGCDFRANVIIINGNENRLENTSFIGNSIRFIGNNRFVKCIQHTRYTLREKCCICNNPITLDDVIIDFKSETFALCKSCVDEYLSALVVAIKL